MAKEIVAWCDVHLARDNAQVPASSVRVAIDDGQPLELDLCEPCEKELVQPLHQLLMEHGQPVVQQPPARSARADKQYVCTVPGCGKAYVRPDGLRQHVAKQHPDSAASEPFVQVPAASIKETPVAPNEAGVYVCPECAREFKKPQGVGRHRLAIHGVVGVSRKHKEPDE